MFESTARRPVRDQNSRPIGPTHSARRIPPDAFRWALHSNRSASVRGKCCSTGMCVRWTPPFPPPPSKFAACGFSSLVVGIFSRRPQNRPHDPVHPVLASLPSTCACKCMNACSYGQAPCASPHLFDLRFVPHVPQGRRARAAIDVMPCAYKFSSAGAVHCQGRAPPARRIRGSSRLRLEPARQPRCVHAPLKRAQAFADTLIAMTPLRASWQAGSRSRTISTRRSSPRTAMRSRSLTSVRCAHATVYARTRAPTSMHACMHAWNHRSTQMLLACSNARSTRAEMGLKGDQDRV